MKKTGDIAVITNVSVEPFRSRELSALSDVIDIPVEAVSVPFMEYREHDDIYSKTGMVFVWLNLESMVPDWEDRDAALLEECASDIERSYQELCRYLSGFSQLKVVIALFEDYFSRLPIVVGYDNEIAVDELNRRIQKGISGQAVFLDMMHMIASVGIGNAYSVKNRYRWGYPYSQALTRTVAAEIYKQYSIHTGNTKKCVVVDCDNVLWGGILSEAGMEGLRLGGSGLGKEYQDFQRFLLALYHRGVLLAVCSKNDLSDVLAVFRGHGEMVLREEHIVCFQVNWDNKPDNIARIAGTLGIGLDSIVFVDDSPVEIEAVRALLPEVTAILYHRETVYGQFQCFNLRRSYKEGEYELRNETYRTDRDRQLLREGSRSYGDYIASLEMQMDIHEAMPLESARIAELTQRTNRCTNGKRYSVADIRQSIERPDVHLYSVHLKDRFSNLGLIGAMEVVKGRLSLFSLSCRALGREVESRMIDFVGQRHKITGIDFAPTGKNGCLKELFGREFPQVLSEPGANEANGEGDAHET